MKSMIGWLLAMVIAFSIAIIRVTASLREMKSMIGWLLPMVIAFSIAIIRVQRKRPPPTAELPVRTCRYCTEVHVGPVGHNLGDMSWTKAEW
ncbi:hypothetical protein R1sor_017410 [Riccia sorocarpa]|uniref:Uncharacterized protein n=1 Tax=Riccia sorocarpa TaxID=122646 RepID=A0ABD3I6S7_9MARC